MIIAWHMVTDVRRDPDAGFLTWKVSFEEIKRTGVILPARMRRKSYDIRPQTIKEIRKYIKSKPFGIFLDNSSIQLIDAIAGDNSYVFLGLVPFGTPMAFLPELFDRRLEFKYDSSGFGFDANGFGFDAEMLVQNGAIVRKNDYLEFYEYIVRRIVSEGLIEKVFNNIEATDEQLDYWLKQADYIETSENIKINAMLYYANKLGKMKDLRKALLEFKAKNDMNGSKALEFVRSAYKKCIDNVHKEEYPPECMPGSDFQCLEILWPGPLHIKNAKYIIEGGVIKRL